MDFFSFFRLLQLRPRSVRLSAIKVLYSFFGEEKLLKKCKQLFFPSLFTGTTTLAVFFEVLLG